MSISVHHGRFSGLIARALVVAALAVPLNPFHAAPSFAQSADPYADVHAASVAGTSSAPVVLAGTCVGNSDPANDGQARYFLTVRDSNGADITNASGKLVAPGYTIGPPFNVTIPNQEVAMTNGDFEAAANPGQSPACTAAANDNHANDLATPPTATAPVIAPFAIPGGPPAGSSLWNIQVSAQGFQTATIPLTADDTTAPCTLFDGRVCLISLGVVTLQSSSAGIGGKNLSLTTGSNGVQLNWSGGAGQTGYTVLRLGGGVLSSISTLGASATSFTDGSPVAGVNCYVLQVAGPNPPQVSDVLCFNSFHSPVGQPQSLTIRLNQSNNATVTWAPPASGSQDGYLFLTVGSGLQTLGGSTTSVNVPVSGLSCYVVGATTSGSLSGYTDWVCGLAGFSTLNP